MTWTHLLCISIYFIINAFLAGANWNEYTNRKKEILAAIIIFFTGLPAGSAIWVWEQMVKKAKYFGVVSWYKFYIKKEFDNLDIKQLEAVEDICKTDYTTKSFNHRMARYWAKKIYKRNNHKPQA